MTTARKIEEKRKTTKVSRQNVNNIENYVKVEEWGREGGTLGRQCGTGDTQRRRRRQRNGKEKFLSGSVFVWQGGEGGGGAVKKARQGRRAC